jgi:hypothetical protein
VTDQANDGRQLRDPVRLLGLATDPRQSVHADQCTSIVCTDRSFLADNLEVYL